MGSITFPNEILSSLSMADESDFYKAVAGVEYIKIEDLICTSRYNYDRAFDFDDDDPGPVFRGGAYCG